ncbi:MAG: hypothetical protein HY064_15810 [Bacteroidetes bacterium]|nr:hypothetical protein [Bacteroidota bacterium]
MLSVVSSSQNIFHVYFSRTGDTVTLVDQKFTHYARDTDFYLISVACENASTHKFDTIVQWNEEWDDNIISNHGFILNSDSAEKYGTIYRGNYLDDDTCRIFSTHFSNTTSQRTSRPKKSYHKDIYPYWFADYKLHTDIEFLDDSTLLYSEKNICILKEDQMRWKWNLGKMANLQHHAVEIRIYRSPVAEVYFVQYIYEAADDHADNSFHWKAFHYIVHP